MRDVRRSAATFTSSVRSRLAVVIRLALLMTTIAATTGGRLRAQQDPGDLRILLTNDDGYRAPGIQAMHEALLGAGYDVVLVAPSENQSSSSGRLSRGVLRYEEAEPGVWHVDGSPGTAVLFALRMVMPDSPPDLVVSGVNFGQNIGNGTASSGTVGAAVHAVRRGIPAIAVSAAITPEGAAARPPYPGTREAFPAAADLVVEMIEDLAESRPAGEALLPDGVMLNVNHPDRTAGELLGVRVEPVSDVSPYDRGFTETGEPGEVETSLSPLGAADLPPESDVRLLAEGWVVINVLEPRANVGAGTREEMERRLSVLAR